MLRHQVIVFIVSLHSIAFYLLITTMMGVKAWYHVVYVVISFALLGYGIGSVACLLSGRLLKKIDPDRLLAISLMMTALLSVATAILIMRIPINVQILTSGSAGLKGLLTLLISYAGVSLPLVVIGFLLSHIFSEYPENSHRLYFFDMVGAGFGSLAFFWMVSTFAPLRSIALLSALLLLASALLLTRLRVSSLALSLGLALVAAIFPEPNALYQIDRAKGWEYLPGIVAEHNLELFDARWHPLGFTSAYLLKEPGRREELAANTDGTFQINIHPRPEYVYIATNHVAGTPIYQLSAAGLSQKQSQIKLFSTSFELPYRLLHQPKVMVIGTGGGRDIHTALSHGSTKILGAEINPATYDILSSGKGLDYSGGLYTATGVQIVNADGRHLARTHPDGDLDLVVLNGVDTFNSLSHGAHTFAESYLYTEEAVIDYLATLKPTGMIYFNRWLFKKVPRESLRLFATVLSALRRTGATNPWDHVMVVNLSGAWGTHLIKKTPFTQSERETLRRYTAQFDGKLVFDADSLAGQQSADPPHVLFTGVATNPFYAYVAALQSGTVAQFEDDYPYDISVVRDDAPFFYKYYKLSSLNPANLSRFYHLGTVNFVAQLVVLLQTVVFIVLFIVVPLSFLKRQGITTMDWKERGAFLSFFSCIGLGYMIIEIPLIQQFVLLLGSPIYSFSVTLVVLLFSSGIGSFQLARWAKNREELLPALTRALILLVPWLLAIFFLGDRIAAAAVVLPFWLRVGVVAGVVGPVGVALGLFFPAGLQLAGTRLRESVAWAWGINAGFSVLGSMGSLLLVQFSGFKILVLTGLLLYLLAWLSFRAWSRRALAQPPG